MCTPSRSISSMLCSVARLTVVPPIGTRASAHATGVSLPVRPTCTRMSSICVSPDARRVLVGDRPARRFAGEAELVAADAMQFTLMTTPSIS